MDSKLLAVIDKVKKLQALSKSNNINEATAAAAAANMLIDQYRIEESALSEDVSELDPMEEDTGYVYETGRIIPWRSALVGVLARHYGVAHFNDIDFTKGRKTSRYKLLGKRSDIAIVRYMYTWLTFEIQRLSGMLKGTGHVFINSYCDGFVAGIKEQLKASRAEVEAVASSAAIIKLNARFEESRQFMYGKHDNLVQKKSSSFSRRDASAFSCGKEQGKSIHLGSALAGSTGPKLLGK